jgi:Kef-type K+ transport system membrane component KefB
LIVLSVVTTIITTGVTPSPTSVVWVIIRTLGLWIALLLGTVYFGSKFVGYSKRWHTKGIIEIEATAICFGAAVISVVMGLHPIVGAFSAGMALAEAKVLEQVKEYIDKINLIFSPIFFAVIGDQLNIWSLNLFSIFGLLLMLAIAVVSKFGGCGLPAFLLTRNRKVGERVGVGMISRGEVGLIIAGIGLGAGAISQDVYAQIVAMAIITTVLASVLVRRMYGKRPIEEKPSIQNTL